MDTCTFLRWKVIDELVNTANVKRTFYNITANMVLHSGNLNCKLSSDTYGDRLQRSLAYKMYVCDNIMALQAVSCPRSLSPLTLRARPTACADVSIPASKSINTYLTGRRLQ